MKKVKYLLVLLTLLLLIPFSVYAEETPTVNNFALNIDNFSVGNEFPNINITEWSEINVSKVNVSWYNTETGELTTDPKTSKYYAKVDITLDNSNIFDVSSEYLNFWIANLPDGYVNGNVNQYVFDENSCTIYIYFEIDKQRIYGGQGVSTTEFIVGQPVPTLRDDYSYYNFNVTTSWHNDTDNIDMNSSSVIEEGKTYTFTAIASPKNGFILDEDTFKLDFYSLQYNNYCYNVSREFVDGKLVTTINFIAKKKIGNVSVPIEYPYIDNTVENTVQVDDGYYYSTGNYESEHSWFNKTDNKEMNKSDKFEANKEYEYRLTLKANDGYAFTNEFGNYYSLTHPYYMGSTAKLSDDNTIYYLYILYLLERKSDEIAEYIKVDATSPKIGDNIKNTNIETDKYTITGTWINKTTKEELSESSKFEENNSYTYIFKLSAKDNYKINPETTYVYIKFDKMITPEGYGGYGSSSDELYTNSIDAEFSFVLSNDLEDEKYISGFISVDTLNLNENVKSLVQNQYNNDPKFTIEEIWYNVTDNKYLSNNDKIELNKKYEYLIRVIPNDGYTIVPNTFDFNIYKDNFYKDYNANYHDGVFDLTVYFDTNIGTTEKDISIDLSKIIPVIGEKPTYLNLELEGFEVEESWSDSTYSNVNKIEIFKENGYYNYNINIRALDGYSIGKVNIDLSKFDNYSYFGSYNYINYHLGFRLKDPKVAKRDANLELDLSNIKTSDYYSSDYVTIFVNSEVNSIEIPIIKVNGSKVVVENTTNVNAEVKDDKIIITGLKDYNYGYVSFKIWGDSTYIASLYNINISKKNEYLSVPEITNYEGNADGEDHTITIAEYDGTLLYSSDGINFSEELPTFNEVGVYKVYVKAASKEGYYNQYPIEGLVILNNEDVIVEQEALSEDSTNYQEMAQVLEEKGYEVYASYEFTLVSGDISEGYVITFDLGEENNGKTAFVLHKKHDGSYEEWTEVVEDGKIYITVHEMSPFLVGFLTNTNNTNNNTNNNQNNSNNNNSGTTTEYTGTTGTVTNTAVTTSNIKSKNPHTSDDITKYLVLFLISLLGTATIIKTRKSE